MNAQIKAVVVLSGLIGILTGCQSNQIASPTQTPKPTLITPFASPKIAGPKAGVEIMIVKQPKSRLKERGTYADFTVLAVPSGAATFQWQKNGSNILGATNKTYSIAEVQVTNVGTYTCEVSSGSGTTTTDPAHLSVFFTYFTNSVAGTLVAPVGAFRTGTATISGQTFDKISSNYFNFYGPAATGQSGDFQNTTGMPKLTVDTYSTDNNLVDTGIEIRQTTFPNNNYPNNNGTDAPPGQPLLSKRPPISLYSGNSKYRVTVYYRSATMGTNTTITFNWLYHE